MGWPMALVMLMRMSSEDSFEAVLSGNRSSKNSSIFMVGYQRIFFFFREEWVVGLERRVEVERGFYFIAGLNYLRVERGFEYDFSPFSECIWGWKKGLEED